MNPQTKEALQCYHAIRSMHFQFLNTKLRVSLLQADYLLFDFILIILRGRLLFMRIHTQRLC